MKIPKGLNIMNNMTQLDFNTLPLFLSERCDHEIDFNDNDDTVNGIVYICIGSEDEWIGFSFKANITKSYTVGELWKDEWGVHCVDVPVIEIENVNNITVSYNDSSDIEILNIDYTSRIDDINKIVSNFIYIQELTAPSKYNVYNV